jgi:hypothetical protein
LQSLEKVLEDKLKKIEERLNGEFKSAPYCCVTTRCFQRPRKHLESEGALTRKGT